jgi:catalase
MPVQNGAVPADGNPKAYQPLKGKSSLDKSAALSMANTVKNSIASRQIAVLVADGVDEASLKNLTNKLMAEGAMVKLVAPKLSPVKGSKGGSFSPDRTFFNAASVLFDAVYIPGGAQSVAALREEPDAIHFVNEAFRHCKAIGADKEAMSFLEDTYIPQKLGNDMNKDLSASGVISNGNIKNFRDAVAKHRFWEREMMAKVPA